MLLKPSGSLAILLLLATVPLERIQAQSTSAKAYCFSTFHPSKNGCTGLTVSRVSDISSIKSTCCRDSNASGQAGYAYLSQPLGFSGYYLCDRCPDHVTPPSRTPTTQESSQSSPGSNTAAHHHHHHHHQHQQQQQQQHTHHHQHQTNKYLRSQEQKMKELTKGSSGSTRPLPISSSVQSTSPGPFPLSMKRGMEWFDGEKEVREWYLKQEKKRMKLTNKTKPDKVSNSVVLDESNDNHSKSKPTRKEIPSSQHQQQQQPQTSPTTTTAKHVTSHGFVSSANLLTGAGLPTKTPLHHVTTHHYHHKSHHHKHHHHHHHHHHHNRHHTHPARERQVTSATYTTRNSVSMTTGRKEVKDSEVWSSWTDWSACTHECVQKRTRFCLIASCSASRGADVEERACSVEGRKSDCHVTTTQTRTSRMDEHGKVRARTSTPQRARATKIPSKTGTSLRRVSTLASSSSSGFVEDTAPVVAMTTSAVRGGSNKKVHHAGRHVPHEPHTPLPTGASTDRVGHGRTTTLGARPLSTVAGISKNEKIVEKEYEWSEWNPCSASCGLGIQVRRRICLSELHPHHHQGHLKSIQVKGKCSIDVVERRPCTMKKCPAGVWSEWKVKVNCTAPSCTGEAGVKTWIRTCTSSTPSGGGRSCQGREWKREICYNNTGCSDKVDGGWCPWKNWVRGSKAIKLRTCECPPPVNGGKHCEGDNEQGLGFEVATDKTTTMTTTRKTSTTTTTSKKLSRLQSRQNCDDEFGSGDGSDVSCDQEAAKKLQQSSLIRSKKVLFQNPIREDEDYEDYEILDNDDDGDDEDDDDGDGVGSGSLKLKK